MTNEQLDEYERLDKAIQIAHDNLSESMMSIASMRIRQEESVTEYVNRLDNAIEKKKRLWNAFEKAKVAKMDFLRAV
jgi:uncharacterized protein (DUF1778 family)